MYSSVIILFLAFAVQVNAKTCSQACTKRNGNKEYDRFITSQHNNLRYLNSLQKPHYRDQNEALKTLKSAALTVQRQRNDYSVKEERISKQAIRQLCQCEKGLKEMLEKRKQSFLCVSLVEKEVKSELFSLFNELFELEYNTEIRFYDNQAAFCKCAETMNNACVEEIKSKAEKEQNENHRDATNITDKGKELIEKVKSGSSRCMKEYLDGFELSKSNCASEFSGTGVETGKRDGDTKEDVENVTKGKDEVKRPDYEDPGFEEPR